MLKTVAHGSLMGARGNSGVILAQLWRGLSERLSAGTAPDDVAEALSHAADLAYRAVAEPVEGTVLSVARAAAEAARAALPGGLVAVVRAAATGAGAALARTPEQLDVLARAGVVDAGGRGLCVLLDALLEVVSGEAPAAAELTTVVPRDRSALVSARESGSDEFGYEVQFLLDAPDEAVPSLRTALGALGDSLVVIGGDGLHSVHVHVNDVGAAIEAGIAAGRPHRILVTRFADQMAATAERPAGSAAIAGVLGTVPDAQRRTRAVVAVASGPGLVELFAASGAHVVSGGPTANPSTGELLDAILATGAAEVLVLPNDSNAHGAAAAAAESARDAGHDVHVVPTRSPVQGLAALAVHDAARTFADDAIGMTTAAAATRWAEVTVAVRDAQTSAGPCRAGDVLGLIDGDVAVIGDDLVDVAGEVVDRLLVSGGELVTVVHGADLDAVTAQAFADLVTTTHPMVDAEVHDGGQPHYPLLLGVE